MSQGWRELVSGGQARQAVLPCRQNIRPFINKVSRHKIKFWLIEKNIFSKVIGQKRQNFYVMSFQIFTITEVSMTSQEKRKGSWSP
jgi:hypothetical protein